MGKFRRLGRACFRCNPARVLRQELPSAFTNHSRKSAPREGTPNRRRDLKKRLGSGRVYSMFEIPESRRGHFESPRKKCPERKTISKGWRRVSSTGSERKRRVCPHTRTIQGAGHAAIAVEIPKELLEFSFKRKKTSSPRVEPLSESEGSGGGHWKSKPKRQKLSIEDDLSQPWESTEEFVRRYKLECRDVKGAPECMKISGFMHEIANPELIKCLHDKIPKSVGEMMRVTTAFLREAKLQEGRLPEPTEVGTKAGQRVAKQKITQTFSPETVISFSPLWEEDRTEGPMIIEAEMGGTFRPSHVCGRRKARSKENTGSSVYNSWNTKFTVTGGTVTLRSSSIIPLECTKVSGLGMPQPVINQVTEEKIQMTFELKSVGATYQRLVDKAFQRQIGWNLEVYVDDLVIKSCTGQEVIRDIEETFKTLSEINMKLNTKKCTLGMREREHFWGTYNHCNHGPTNKADTIKSEVIGKLLKWSFELEEHDIQYRPRTSVKGQILADFIVERPKDDPPNIPMEDEKELLDPWTLFTDGSSCIYGSEAGLIIMNQKGMEFPYAIRFRFNATNNEAEYEALIAGLWIAEEMGVKNLQANVDLRLVASQHFQGAIKQVPRGENKKADALSKMASTSFTHLSKQVLAEELKEKSIDEKEVLAVVEEEGRTWMTPIHEYLKKDILPKKRESPEPYAARQEDMLVRNTSFKLGNLVYRNKEASHAEDEGKLEPKWEGPYEVTKALGQGAYKLRDRNRNILP
nr:reverse transcriptase domain-containing protein [Tanacetum cinerariifolium]